MRRLLSLLIPALLVAPTTTSASTAEDKDPNASVYTVDKSHSRIAFQVRHLGISKVTGVFGEYDVDLRLDPSDISTMEASANVEIASIDTGVEKRDGHLKSADFFSAESFPQMTFKSTAVRPTSDQTFELVGDLTIRDVTREIVLSGELVGPVVGPMGGTRVAFDARGTISRSEFGLTWNKLTEAGGIIVADEVDIILDLQAVKEVVGS